MILGILIGLVIGFVAGVFVFRNNTALIEPFAEKIDELTDEVKELKSKLEKK